MYHEKEFQMVNAVYAFKLFVSRRCIMTNMQLNILPTLEKKREPTLEFVKGINQP